ncbi:unnamed protein product [Laminaria digitata]
MEATTRIRLFNTRSADEEDGRGARGQRRRVDSVGRGRRRRHNRAPKRRFFFGILRTRRAMLLLLLVTGAAGPFVSLRLLGWASSNTPRAPAGGDLNIIIKDNPPSVSLGPGSIPSVVRVKRQAPLSAPATPALSGYAAEKRHDVCRNTVQGVALLADSEGRVCRRADLDRRRPGCCNALPLSSWAAGGDNLPDAGAEAVASMEGYAIEDTTALPPPPPPPRASMSLRADRWRKEAGGIKEGFTPRALTAAAAGRHLTSRREGAEDGVPPEKALSVPFSCWSCDAGESGGTSSSCCASYEFCVSCCQDPRRNEEREAVRAAAVRSGHPAYGGLGYGGGGSGAAGSGKVSAPALPLQGKGVGIDDKDSYREAAFDHCAFRCRTYSGSVVHENSFRGPLKHCFGRFRPPATPDVASNSGGDGGGRVDGSMASQGGGPPPLQLDPFLVGYIGE